MLSRDEFRKPSTTSRGNEDNLISKSKDDLNIKDNLKTYKKEDNLKIKIISKNAAKRGRQHARSSKGCLPPKVIFHRRSSSTEGCLSLKVIFILQPKVVFH